MKMWIRDPHVERVEQTECDDAPNEIAIHIAYQDENGEARMLVLHLNAEDAEELGSKISLAGSAGFGMTLDPRPEEKKRTFEPSWNLDGC